MLQSTQTIEALALHCMSLSLQGRAFASKHEYRQLVLLKNAKVSTAPQPLPRAKLGLAPCT